MRYAIAALLLVGTVRADVTYSIPVNFQPQTVNGQTVWVGTGTFPQLAPVQGTLTGVNPGYLNYQGRDDVSLSNPTGTPQAFNETEDNYFALYINQSPPAGSVPGPGNAGLEQLRATATVAANATATALSAVGNTDLTGSLHANVANLSDFVGTGTVTFTFESAYVNRQTAGAPPLSVLGRNEQPSATVFIHYATAVPEPSSVALVGLAVGVGLTAKAWRRGRRGRGNG